MQIYDRKTRASTQGNYDNIYLRQGVVAHGEEDGEVVHVSCVQQVNLWILFRSEPYYVTVLKKGKRKRKRKKVTNRKKDRDA